MTRRFPSRLVLVAIAVHAASPALADLSECGDLNSNMEMTACAWKQYEAADAELNAVWKQVIAAIKATGTDIMPASAAKDWQKSMTDAQKAWAAFKDDDCNGGVSYEWFGGSGANQAITMCLYDHTVARTKELRERHERR